MANSPETPRIRQLNRRDARRKAFELLFELEQHSGLTPSEAVARSFEPDVAEHYLSDEDGEGFVAGEADRPAREFIGELVHAVKDNQPELDVELAKYPHDWSYDRIGRVERVLLRMALAEIAVMGTAEKVAINEVIELSKQYADEEAARFINGILGSAVGNIEALKASLTKQADENVQ